MKKLWKAAVLAAAMACAAAGSAYAGGWVTDNGRWWYQTDESGASWLSSGWYWLDGDGNGVAECYYFDADGYMLADTVTPDQCRVNADGAWVDEAGSVQTRAAESAYAGGWVADNGRWWYQTDESGASWLSSGWYWLDGDGNGVAECYYFGPDGYMLANTITPDQYRVNADGAWVDEAGSVQTRAAGQTGAGQPAGAAAGAEGQSAGAEGSAGGQPAGAEGSAEGTEGEQSGAGAGAEGTEEQPAAGRIIDPNLPMVALTYDDGPQTDAGNQILDILAQYGAKATFFLVGERCASRAAEVQRMVAEGHEVGNHTYQHKYLQKLGAEAIRYQIDQGSAAITAACGVAPALVRLPGGNKNATVLANVNYPMIQWSIDTRDWEHRNAQRTIDEVLGKVQSGDIVLMHELYGATAAATAVIVPELTARGYQLVTVSEMAAAKGIPLEAGKLYYHFR